MYNKWKIVRNAYEIRSHLKIFIKQYYFLTIYFFVDKFDSNIKLNRFLNH